MTGERYLQLTEKARLGTIRAGEVQELLSAVARLRVAVALANDEIKRLRHESVSSMAPKRPG